MEKYNLFNFRFGKIKRGFRYYLRLSVILYSSIELLDYVPGVSKKTAFNTIDRIQQFLGSDYLNDFIIKDPDLLNYRIERVLDDALRKAKKQYGN